LVVESKQVYLCAGDTNARSSSSSSSSTTTTGEEELGNFLNFFPSTSDCALTDVVKRRG
jgi:hypothetical protein